MLRGLWTSSATVLCGQKVGSCATHALQRPPGRIPNTYLHGPYRWECRRIVTTWSPYFLAVVDLLIENIRFRLDYLAYGIPLSAPY
jgi:hypothetical protein